MRGVIAVALLTTAFGISVNSEKDAVNILKVKSYTDAKTWASADAAMNEVQNLCGNLDFEHSMQVLQAHSKPLGFQKGKELLRACFLDMKGTCMLGDLACEWMTKCLGTDGPCNQPPIEASFLQIGGGQEALHMMTRSKVNNTMIYDAKQVTDALSNLAKEHRAELDLSMDHEHSVGDDPRFGTRTATNPAGRKWNLPQGIRSALWTIQKGREEWIQYIPDVKRRKWFVELASLGLWMVIACGTEYSQVKMVGLGKYAQPIHAWYAPEGYFREGKPAYKDAIYQATLPDVNPNNWKC